VLPPMRLRTTQRAALSPVRMHNRRVASTAAIAESRFRPETGLKWIGGFFAYGLGLTALYAATGVGLPCPFRAVTGWNCPLCGGTRMGEALLHLDIGAAFSYNPLALIGLVLLAALGVLWTVQVAGGPAVRLPTMLRNRVAAVGQTRWLIAGVIGMVAYTVLRNL
jgi:hypothetical protein